MHLEDSITLTWVTVAIAGVIGFVLGHWVGIARATRYCVDKADEATKAATDAAATAVRELLSENSRCRVAIASYRQTVDSQKEEIRRCRQELELIHGAEQIQPTRERNQ